MLVYTLERFIKEYILNNLMDEMTQLQEVLKEESGKEIKIEILGSEESNGN